MKDIEKDLSELKKNLIESEKENEQYAGGLLGALSLTKTTTIKNTISFLEQRRLLLKHDIPYYSLMPEGEKQEPGFESTPGDDVDKF